MQDVKEKIPFLNSDQRKKETAVIGRVSMVAGFREVKLSRSRKFKTRYFPGGKTKDIQYLLVPYLNKSPDNIIISSSISLPKTFHAKIKMLYTKNCRMSK